MGLGALDELQQQRPQVVDLVDDPVRPGVLVGGLEIRLLELAERLGECRQQLLGMPDTVLAFGLDGSSLPAQPRTPTGRPDARRHRGRRLLRSHHSSPP